MSQFVFAIRWHRCCFQFASDVSVGPTTWMRDKENLSRQTSWINRCTCSISIRTTSFFSARIQFYCNVHSKWIPRRTKGINQRSRRKSYRYHVEESKITNFILLNWFSYAAARFFPFNKMLQLVACMELGRERLQMSRDVFFCWYLLKYLNVVHDIRSYEGKRSLYAPLLLIG